MHAISIGDPPGAAPWDAPLLERELALGAVADALDQAHAGIGSAILVHGGHGLGKSRLLASAETLAGREGLTVLGGAGHELEQEFGFGVVLQLFDPALEYAGDDEREELLRGAAREANAVLKPGRRPAKDSFRTLRGLYWLTANLTSDAPLMLSVDDVDLADARSLRFLLYLLEHVASIPAVVVLALGAGMRVTDRDLLRQLERHPAASHLRLEPLSETATAQLVRVLLPDAGDDVCRAAHDATRGSPWLIVALAEAMSRVSPSAAEVAAAAPRPVAERMLHRVDALGSDAARVVSAVATLGDDAELRHVAELADLDSLSAGALVDELIAGGLLKGDRRISFSAPLLRRAAGAAVPPARRSELHRRAAQLLADDGAGAMRLAEHLLETVPAAHEWTVDVLSQAAADAMEQGAPHVAVTYLRRALEEPPRANRRARVSMGLGRAEATAGDPAAVGHLLGAIEAIPDRRERAEISLDAGRTLLVLGRRADAAETFRRGLRELDDPTDELFGRLSAAHEVIRYLWPTGEERVPPEPVGEAPPRGETPRDRALRAQLALQAALQGDPRHRVIDLAVRALDRGALLRNETADGLAYYLACQALTIAEDLGPAEIALSAAVEDGIARGSVLGTATAHFFRSLAFLRRGDIREAAADARRAIGAERHGWRFARSAARAVLAEAVIELGSLTEARQCLKAVEAASGEDFAARVALTASRAHVAALCGSPQEALADFLECGRLLERMRARNPAVVPWRSGAARALASMGDRDAALSLLDEELDLAEAFGAPGVIGLSLRVRGAIEGGERGLEALEAAVERLEGSQAALERARALVDYGAALRRSRRRKAAREPLLRGLDLARHLGAEALRRRAIAEAKAAGARPRRTALKGKEALTAREEQVARLAAEGRSNREIASELVITQKTVEWHLRHAFQKLGLSSRGELSGALGMESDRTELG
jgi:DNA-binding CsgD family transcriptional regulator